MSKNLFMAFAGLLALGGAAVAEDMITHERFVNTKSGIESLSPEQRARFDTEKARLLSEINRGPDGQLLASAQTEEKAAPARKHHRKHARRSRRAHRRAHRKAKVAAAAEQATATTEAAASKVAQPDEPAATPSTAPADKK